jgi:hypothetical protein
LDINELDWGKGSGANKEDEITKHTEITEHTKIVRKDFWLYGNSGGEARQIVVSESPAPNISSLTT